MGHLQLDSKQLGQVELHLAVTLSDFSSCFNLTILLFTPPVSSSFQILAFTRIVLLKRLLPQKKVLIFFTFPPLPLLPLLHK